MSSGSHDHRQPPHTPFDNHTVSATDPRGLSTYPVFLNLKVPWY